jgi:PAS domain S-box-containing protein
MEEKERLRRILQLILLLTMASAAIFLLIGWLANFADVIMMSTLTLVSALGMLALTRRGHLNLPRLWLPTLLLLMTTHIIARSGGMRDQGVLLYPVLITIAGLLLGKRSVIIFTVLSVIALTGVALGEMTGRLITRYGADVTWTSIIVLDALLVGMSVILYLTIHNLTRSLEQARRSERALQTAQAALRQERDTAQLYLDAAGVIMLALDPEQRVQLINQKGLATLECELEDIIGQNWFDAFIPARDREKTRALFAQLFNGQVVPDLETFENTIVTRAGVERVMTWHNVVLRDAHGHVTGTFSSGEDITARVQAEGERQQAAAALRESEARYRRLVDNAPIGILAIGTQGEITDVNPKMLDIIGSPSAEVTQAINVLTFPPLVAAGLTEQIRECLETGENRSAERLYQSRWGKAVYLRIQATSIQEDDGTIVGVQSVVEDITERKQVEAQREAALAELQEAKRRMADIINFLPEATFVIDREGCVIAWNQAIEALTGVAREEILGQGDYAYSVALYGEKRPSLIDLVFLPDPAFEKAEYQNVQRNGDTLFAEAYVPRVYNGRGAYLWGTTSLLRNANGEVVGAIESIHDLTKRKQAENALRESLSRLRAIYEGSYDALMLLTAEGFFDCNPRTLDMFGFAAKEDLIHTHPADISPPYQPDGMDSLRAAGEHIQAAYQHGAARFEWVHRRTDGQDFPCEVLLSAFTLGDRQVLQATVRDITARKLAEATVRESELKYRTLIDQSASIVLEWDAEGRVLFLNPYGLEFFGFTMDEILGQNLVGTLAPPVDSTGYDLENKIGHIQQQPDVYRSVENENMRQNGERVWIAWTNKGIYAPDGRLLKTLSIGIDRTRQKEMERKLREHEQQIAQQNQAFVTLVGNKNLYTGDTTGALQMITEAAARGLAVQWASIWFYTPDQAGIYCADLYELEVEQHTRGSELYARDFPRYFAALQDERIIVAEDAYTHPHTAELAVAYLTPLGINAMLDIPIRAGGRMVGVLCCEHVGGPRAWSLEEQNFGAAIAGVISTVLETEERLRAENALRQANAELSARLEELAMLNQITQTVAARLDLGHILNSVAEMMLHLFDVSAVLVSMLDPVHNGLTIMAHLTRAAGAPLLVGKVLPLAAAHLFAKLQEHKRPYVLARTDPATPLRSVHNELPMADVQCLLNVPLTSRDAVIGVITLTTDRPDREFTVNQINLAGAIAGQVAGAIENARLFAETQRRAEHLALLNRIGVTITTGLEMTQVLRSLYEQCRQIVALDCFYVALYEENTGLIHFPFFYDNEKPVQTRARQIQDEPGLTGLVIEAAQTVYIPDTLAPQEAQADGIVRTGGIPIRSYVGVPLKVRQKVIGVLSMQSYAPDVYTEEQIGLLETIATQAAFAIDNARLYDAALEAQRAAEAANRAKSIFLANMSHELRTPLNAVLGFTQLMANDANLTGVQRENLSIMSRSGEHLLALINDVLEMSKIETGRVELRLERFDVRHMLQGLEEMFQLRARQKGLTLTFDLADDIPQHIHADEGKLRQVLINLLSNAVKFTETGGVTLKVSYSLLPTSSSVLHTSYSTLHFAVDDTGVGIAPEEMEVLFNAFIQTSSGRQSGEGTGLGLPISQQYVRLMGGDLHVSSAPGLGSCFAFDLPLTAPVNGTDAGTAPAFGQIVGLMPGQSAPDGGPYRLLVVEDVSANRKLLVDLLHSWRARDDGPPGLDVREAINGQEAVTQWAAWQPHLIWMDIRMPVLDGYEATRQIRARAKAENAPAPVIVALTAGAFEEERARILTEGCDDFVRKPFQQTEIGAVLTRHLGLRFVYHAPPEINADIAAADGAVSPQSTALRGAFHRQPAAWQTMVRQAVIEGDSEWIMSLIGQLQPDASALAERLTEWVDNFAHHQILEFFDEEP